MSAAWRRRSCYEVRLIASADRRGGGRRGRSQQRAWSHDHAPVADDEAYLLQVGDPDEGIALDAQQIRSHPRDESPCSAHSAGIGGDRCCSPQGIEGCETNGDPGPVCHGCDVAGIVAERAPGDPGVTAASEGYADLEHLAEVEAELRKAVVQSQPVRIRLMKRFVFSGRQVGRVSDGGRDDDAACCDALDERRIIGNAAWGLEQAVLDGSAWSPTARRRPSAVSTSSEKKWQCPPGLVRGDPLVTTLGPTSPPDATAARTRKATSFRVPQSRTVVTPARTAAPRLCTALATSASTPSARSAR
jgi:hypothetical protein